MGSAEASSRAADLARFYRALGRLEVAVGGKPRGLLHGADGGTPAAEQCLGDGEDGGRPAKRFLRWFDEVPASGSDLGVQRNHCCAGLVQGSSRDTKVCSRPLESIPVHSSPLLAFKMSHNLKVAGSNPAPQPLKPLETLPFSRD